MPNVAGMAKLSPYGVAMRRTRRARIVGALALHLAWFAVVVRKGRSPGFSFSSEEAVRRSKLLLCLARDLARIPTDD